MPFQRIRLHLYAQVPGGEGGRSMRDMLAERLSNGQLNLIRPDSGEAIETLPQLLTLLSKVSASDRPCSCPNVLPFKFPR